jgi:hypothetical protein
VRVESLATVVVTPVAAATVVVSYRRTGDIANHRRSSTRTRSAQH